MVKTALAAMCVLLLLATGYLSLSLVILNPPRANVPVWFALAAVFVTQSVLTLVALQEGRPEGLRFASLAGGAVIAAIGVWMVGNTLTSAHFEGYALVLGSMLVVQALLTGVEQRRP